MLAWLQKETRAELVERLLPEAAISAVNWSEVLQMVIQRGRDAGETSDLLRALGLQVMPLTMEDAALAAGLGTQAPSLSLGDRCCLALARRLGAPAVTADRNWQGLSLDVEMQPIR